MKSTTLGAVALSAVCCIVSPTVARSAGPADGSVILDTRPVSFPAYDAYKGIARYAPTPEAYQRVIADRRFVMERLTYRSDSLEVYAYLYRPAKPPAGQRLPVVVFNRGSYVRDDFSPEVLMLANRIAPEGYVVIAPMLRGSGGAAGHDAMGGDDLHDLQNIVPVVEALPYADAGRLFLYGESRGGIMTLLAIKHGFPAKAAAIYGAITDMSGYLAEGGQYRELGAQIWPGFPANEAEIVESRSAVRWPDRLSIPILIMNGGDDRGVPPSHALELAGALAKLGKPYELVIFHGEKHVLSGRAAERDAHTVDWFRRFDLPPAKPDR